MKKAKLAFNLVVAVLNGYYFVTWAKAYANYSDQSERVGFFLGMWPFFDTVGLLNIFLGILTIVSMVLVNLRPHPRNVVRHSLSVIHTVFILAILWSSL